jgi:hypothetical protein
MDKGIPTPGGKISWRPNTVESILTNEKYKGDAILQKSFTVDFLTKRKKVNEGEIPQYYVEGSHPAIIEPEVFDAVQVELKNRKAPGRRNYTPHCFSGRIYCGECGTMYGSKVWNSGSRYKSLVWQCNAKHRGYLTCETPSMRTKVIQEAFVHAFNQIVDNKDEIIQICEATLAECCDNRKLSGELSELHAKLEIITGLMQQHISANAQRVLDQVEYQKQYNAYAARYTDTKNRIVEIQAQQEALTARRGQISCYLHTLRKQHLISEFDENLWYGTIE